MSDFLWHEALDLFIYLSQDKLHICYSPESLFLDSDLAEFSTKTIILPSKNIRISSFNGSLVETLSLKSSVRQNFSLSPQAFSLLSLFLSESSSQKIMEKALKLCRFCNDPLLWSILASKALSFSDLLTAEVALASLNLIDKVRLINKIHALENSTSSKLETFLLLKKTEKANRLMNESENGFNIVRYFVRSFLFTEAWEKAKGLGDSDPSLSWLQDYVLYKRKRYIKETCNDQEFEYFFKLHKPNLSEEQVKEKKKAYLGH